MTIINADLVYDVANNQFPLVTTRKSYWKSAIAELIGYLRGYSSAADFRALGTKTWDANAKKNIAFHSSVLTTQRYLSAHNINKKAREEINVALDTIYQSAVSDKAKLPYATEETAFKGILEKLKTQRNIYCDLIAQNRST